MAAPFDANAVTIYGKFSQFELLTSGSSQPEASASTLRMFASGNGKLYYMPAGPSGSAPKEISTTSGGLDYSLTDGDGIADFTYNGSAAATVSVDITNATALATVADADTILIDDGDGGTVKKITRANYLGSLLASLDAGIDVNGANFTVSTAGAVVAASLNNSAGGITNAGAISGATTMTGSGQLSAFNAVLAAGGTLGVSTDTDLLTLASNSLTLAGDLTVNGTGKQLIKTTTNSTEAIMLHADAGTSQTIKLVNDAGTRADAITLVATAGGMDFNAAGTVDIYSSAGNVKLSGSAGSGIYTSAGAVTLDGKTGFSMKENGTEVFACDTSKDMTFGAASVSSLTMNINGAIDIDANGTLAIDSASTMSISTANSGVAVNIGHTTSETTVGDNFTVTGDADFNNAVQVYGTLTGDRVTSTDLVATTADINGGTVDGTIIGASSAAAGTFTAVVGTTLSGSGTISGFDLDMEGAGNFLGNLTVQGNLVVEGTRTVIDTTDLLIEDNLIEMNRGDGSAGTAQTNAAAGIFISGSTADRAITITGASDGGRLKVSGSSVVGAGYDVITGGDYAINGTSVLTATTLGSAVVASSLTSVGTLSAVTVSGLAAFNGSVDLGDATADTITATGRFDSDLVPSTDSARDLGTSALQWAELHVDAGYIDQLGAALDANSQNITNVGTFEVDGAATFNGNVTLGNAGSDVVTSTGQLTASVGGLVPDNQLLQFGTGADCYIKYVSANDILAVSGTASGTVIAGDFMPSVDDTFDLGNASMQWRNIHIDGYAYIDGLSADTLESALDANSQAITNINVDSGAIDGTVIGANSAAAGTFAAVIGTTGVYSGILKTDDTTDATSKTDGSLQTDGGLSVAKAIYNGTAATLAADSGVVTMGVATALTVSAAGLLNVNNATEATSTTDGSLQTDGGLSVVKSAVIGDDLDLLSDGAIINIGSTSKFTLTDQAANNCVMAASGARLAFGNAGEYISGDGTDLDIISSGDLDITATLVDITGALTVSGATTLNGAVDIGNATSDTVTVTGRFDSNLVPSTDSARDLGSTSLHFANAYLDKAASVTGALTLSASLGVAVTGTANASGYLLELPTTGDARARAWVTYSSVRHKTNVQTLENPVQTLKQLRGVSYDWKGTGQNDVGFIAEEVGAIVPEVVSFGKDGRAEGIDYGRLTSVLVEAMKQQQGEIEKLQSVVRNLTTEQPSLLKTK